MSGTQLTTPVQPIELTKEGLADLKKELLTLKTVKLPSVIERVSIARDHGDLSENSEYHDARAEQDLVEARLDEIEIVLAKAVVVKETHSTIKVGIGSKVTVKTEKNKKSITLHIVGEFEGDPKNNKVSSTSPVGKALVHKKKGDVVVVKAPGGEVEYTIESIS
ncbi:transcription elongation factor GreA [Candidatus Woesebacteria bacterium]|nr:transcription elongation factor GreA [Candidatus Woesebacteria bacterium]